MRSRLYTGTTSHARTTPVRNAFRYPVYYLGLDLDEIDQVAAGLRRLAHNGSGFTALWDRDHGPRDGSALRPWIETTCARVGIDLTGGRIMLLAFPRVMGARFFPVSFWYCYDADGIARAVLAEVQNTYRDHHNYLLHDHGAPFDFSKTHTTEKVFFVSPFMPTDGVCYEFDVSEPGETLRVRIRDMMDGKAVVTAAIDLTAQDLTDETLRRTVLAHGPVSIVALIRIHWQALKLLAKRVPFYPHTKPPAEETSL